MAPDSGLKWSHSKKGTVNWLPKSGAPLETTSTTPFKVLCYPADSHRGKEALEWAEYTGITEGAMVLVLHQQWNRYDSLYNPNFTRGRGNWGPVHRVGIIPPPAAL